VVLGGLVSSTVVSLFVLPAMYLRLAPDVPAQPALHEEQEAPNVAN
jgi:Cu/Ag efflux pump CusA